jgi:hypothetical protein
VNLRMWLPAWHRIVSNQLQGSPYCLPLLFGRHSRSLQLLGLEGISRRAWLSQLASTGICRRTNADWAFATC